MYEPLNEIDFYKHAKCGHCLTILDYVQLTFSQTLHFRQVCVTSSKDERTYYRTYTLNWTQCLPPPVPLSARKLAAAYSTLMHGGLKLGPSVSKIVRSECEAFDCESGDGRVATWFFNRSRQIEGKEKRIADVRSRGEETAAERLRLAGGFRKPDYWYNPNKGFGTDPKNSSMIIGENSYLPILMLFEMKLTKIFIFKNWTLV